MRRADEDVLKKYLIGKINKKTSTWKTKNKIERHHRKLNEVDRWNSNVRLDFGQEKIEMLTGRKRRPLSCA